LFGTGYDAPFRSIEVFDEGVQAKSIGGHRLANRTDILASDRCHPEELLEERVNIGGCDLASFLAVPVDGERLNL